LENFLFCALSLESNFKAFLMGLLVGRRIGTGNGYITNLTWPDRFPNHYRVRADSRRQKGGI
jgi:hypothetical protein